MKCPNCKAPIEQIDGFCWNCGQKNKDGRITLKEFFKDVLENVLNIDAKIFRTIGHLFIPGKLSNRYFDGQRQQYFSPFRIFFMTAVIHFALLSYIGSKSINEENSSGDQITRIGNWDSFKLELDTAKTTTLETFPDMAKLPTAMDTLYAHLPKFEDHSLDIEYFYLDKSWSAKKKEVTLSYEEIAKYSPEELADRHEVEGWIEHVIFQQMVKLIVDGKSFILFLVKNLLWMVIVMMVGLAGILKLLYIRRKRYLIEHLVFAFHYHSFAFIIASIALSLSFFLDSEAWLSWGALAIMVYLFISMKRFYKQSRFKTFIKFSILNFSYLFIFVFSIALTFVISVFIF